MRRLAFALMLLAAPAAAADPKDFDLGYARIGMMQGQYRFAAWPAGTNIWCSDDPSRPRAAEKLIALPRQMQMIGGVRCALFSQDDKDEWRPTQRKIAGTNTEMTATFGPDEQGVSRLVQLFLQQPRSGFDGLVAHFTQRFGPPNETTPSLVRWTGLRGEALVMHEDGDTALAMVVDMRLQALLNGKMSRR